MSIRRILALSLAASAFSGAAWASDTYQCGQSRCYDDQADETRQLNLMQLDEARATNDGSPGYGSRGYDNAVGAYDQPDDEPYDNADDDDMNGQGGPYDPYDPDEDNGMYGPPPPADGGYDPEDAEPPPPYGPPDTDAYPDDQNGDGPYDDEDDDAPYSPYPDDE